MISTMTSETTNLEAVKAPKSEIKPAKEQYTAVGKSIAKLLNDLGLQTEVYKPEFSVRIDNAPFMFLSIQRIDGGAAKPQLAFTHYVDDKENSGDMWIDCELVVEANDLGAIYPVQTAVQNPIKGGESRGYDPSFARMFAANLNRQGFGKLKNPKRPEKGGATLTMRYQTESADIDDNSTNAKLRANLGVDPHKILWQMTGEEFLRSEPDTDIEALKQRIAQAQEQWDGVVQSLGTTTGSLNSIKRSETQKTQVGAQIQNWTQMLSGLEGRVQQLLHLHGLEVQRAIAQGEAVPEPVRAEVAKREQGALILVAAQSGDNSKDGAQVETLATVGSGDISEEETQADDPFQSRIQYDFPVPKGRYQTRCLLEVAQLKDGRWVSGVRLMLSASRMDGGLTSLGPFYESREAALLFGIQEAMDWIAPYADEDWAIVKHGSLVTQASIRDAKKIEKWLEALLGKEGLSLPPRLIYSFLTADRPDLVDQQVATIPDRLLREMALLPWKTNELIATRWRRVADGYPATWEKVAYFAQYVGRDLFSVKTPTRSLYVNDWVRVDQLPPEIELLWHERHVNHLVNHKLAEHLVDPTLSDAKAFAEKHGLALETKQDKDGFTFITAPPAAVPQAVDVQVIEAHPLEAVWREDLQRLLDARSKEQATPDQMLEMALQILQQPVAHRTSTAAELEALMEHLRQEYPQLVWWYCLRDWEAKYAEQGLPIHVRPVRSTDAQGWCLAQDGTHFGMVRQEFSDIVAAADRENYRLHQIDDQKQEAEAGFPQLLWGRAEADYLKAIPSEAAYGRFLAEAREVGAIAQPYKKREPVYYLPSKEKLVRVGSATSNSRPMHEVSLEVYGEHFTWKQSKAIAAIAEKFGATVTQKEKYHVADAGVSAEMDRLLKPARNMKTQIVQTPAAQLESAIEPVVQTPVALLEETEAIVPQAVVVDAASALNSCGEGHYMKGRVRGIVNYAEREWICLSHTSGGASGFSSVGLCEVVPFEQWTEATRPSPGYRQEMPGSVVSHKRHKYVLTGHRLTLKNEKPLFPVAEPSEPEPIAESTVPENIKQNDRVVWTLNYLGGDRFAFGTVYRVKDKAIAGGQTFAIDDPELEVTAKVLLPPVSEIDGEHNRELYETNVTLGLIDPAVGMRETNLFTKVSLVNRIPSCYALIDEDEEIEIMFATVPRRGVTLALVAHGFKEYAPKHWRADYTPERWEIALCYDPQASGNFPQPEPEEAMPSLEKSPDPSIVEVPFWHLGQLVRIVATGEVAKIFRIEDATRRLYHIEQYGAFVDREFEHDELCALPADWLQIGMVCYYQNREFEPTNEEWIGHPAIVRALNVPVAGLVTRPQIEWLDEEGQPTGDFLYPEPWFLRVLPGDGIVLGEVMGAKPDETPEVSVVSGEVLSPDEQEVTPPTGDISEDRLLAIHGYKLIQRIKKLRESANGLDKEIARRRAAALACNGITLKRAAEANAAYELVKHLRSMKALVLQVAEAAIEVSLPQSLSGLTHRNQVEAIWGHNYPSLHFAVTDIRELIQVAETDKDVQATAPLALQLLRQVYEETPVDCLECAFESTPDAIQALDRLTKSLKKLSVSKKIREVLDRYNCLQIAGIKDAAEFQAASTALNAYWVNDEPPLDEQIASMTRELLLKPIPGFHPTPNPLGVVMVGLADPQPDETIWEPSAGRGDLAEIVKQRYPDHTLVVSEIHPQLNDLLKLKGFTVVGTDALRYKEQHHCIIGNPPFEKGQDVDHCRYYYSCLRPGGRLVCLMSAAGFTLDDQKYIEFRDWLESIHAFAHKLPAAAFAGAERTGKIQVWIVVADVPVEHGQAPTTRVDPKALVPQEPEPVEPEAMPSTLELIDSILDKESQVVKHLESLKADLLGLGLGPQPEPEPQPDLDDPAAIAQSIVTELNAAADIMRGLMDELNDTPAPAAACPHPSERLYAWFTPNAVTKRKDWHCVTCCDCGVALEGSSEEYQAYLEANGIDSEPHPTQDQIRYILLTLLAHLREDRVQPVPADLQLDEVRALTGLHKIEAERSKVKQKQPVGYFGSSDEEQVFQRLLNKGYVEQRANFGHFLTETGQALAQTLIDSRNAPIELQLPDTNAVYRIPSNTVAIREMLRRLGVVSDDGDRLTLEQVTEPQHLAQISKEEYEALQERVSTTLAIIAAAEAKTVRTQSRVQSEHLKVAGLTPEQCNLPLLDALMVPIPHEIHVAVAVRGGMQIPNWVRCDYVDLIARINTLQPPSPKSQRLIHESELAEHLELTEGCRKLGIDQDLLSNTDCAFPEVSGLIAIANLRVGDRVYLDGRRVKRECCYIDHQKAAFRNAEDPWDTWLFLSLDEEAYGAETVKWTLHHIKKLHEMLLLGLNQDGTQWGWETVINRDPILQHMHAVETAIGEGLEVESFILDDYSYLKALPQLLLQYSDHLTDADQALQMRQALFKHLSGPGGIHPTIAAQTVERLVGSDEERSLTVLQQLFPVALEVTVVDKQHYRYLQTGIIQGIDRQKLPFGVEVRFDVTIYGRAEVQHGKTLFFRPDQLEPVQPSPDPLLPSPDQEKGRCADLHSGDLVSDQESVVSTQESGVRSQESVEPESKSEFPEPADIPPAAFDEHWDPIKRTHGKNKKPKPSLEDQLQAWNQNLERDVQRYRELLTKGDAACSPSDLSNGYDWRFNADLARNHIAYDKAVIQHIERAIAPKAALPEFSILKPEAYAKLPHLAEGDRVVVNGHTNKELNGKVGEIRLVGRFTYELRFDGQTSLATSTVHKRFCRPVEGTEQPEKNPLTTNNQQPTTDLIPHSPLPTPHLEEPVTVEPQVEETEPTTNNQQLTTDLTPHSSLLPPTPYSLLPTPHLEEPVVEPQVTAPSLQKSPEVEVASILPKSPTGGRVISQGAWLKFDADFCGMREDGTPSFMELDYATGATVSVGCEIVDYETLPPLPEGWMPSKQGTEQVYLVDETHERLLWGFRAHYLPNSRNSEQGGSWLLNPIPRSDAMRIMGGNSTVTIYPDSLYRIRPISVAGWQPDPSRKIPRQLISQAAYKALPKENKRQITQTVSQAIPAWVESWQPSQKEAEEVFLLDSQNNRLIWGFKAKYNKSRGCWILTSLPDTPARKIYRAKDTITIREADLHRLRPASDATVDTGIRQFVRRLEPKRDGKMWVPVTVVNYEVIPPHIAWVHQLGDQVYFVDVPNDRLIWGFEVNREHQLEPIPNTDAAWMMRKFHLESDDLGYPEDQTLIRPKEAGDWQPVPPPPEPKEAKETERRLEGDYGVTYIDAYTDAGARIKEAFHNNARAYLKALGKALGWDTHTNVNKAGPAVSGEVHGTFFKPESLQTAWVEISGGAFQIPGVRSSPSGIAIMWRTGHTWDPSEGGNHWIDWDITVSQFAEMIRAAVVRQEESDQRGQEDYDKAARNANSVWRVDPHFYLKLREREKINERAYHGKSRRRSTTKEPDPLTRIYRDRLEIMDAWIAPRRETQLAAVLRANVDRRVLPESVQKYYMQDLLDAATEALPPPDPALIERVQQNSRDIRDIRGLEGLKPEQKTVETATVEVMPPPEAQDEELTESAVKPMQGIDRRTKAIRKVRIEANQAANQVLTAYTDDQIREDVQLQRQLAAYSGRGGTDVSDLNEYYSQPDIVAFCWAIAQIFGFTKGVALEAGCGSGNFIGLAPPGFICHGIEMDPTSARIAKVLYGDRHVIENRTFQEFAQDKETKPIYTLAIGNPPYGSFEVEGNIETANYLYAEASGKLEQMFILAQLDLLVLGGLMIVVVPYSIVSGKDATRSKFREEVVKRGGQFVGAIRLPNVAHKAAGTNFITDVVIIRKSRFAASNQARLDKWLGGEYFGSGWEKENFILGKEGKRARWSSGGEKDMTYDVVGELNDDIWDEVREKAHKYLRSWFHDILEAKAVKSEPGDVVTLNQRQFKLTEKGDWEPVIAEEAFDLTPADFNAESFDEAITLLLEQWPELDMEQTVRYHRLLTMMDASTATAAEQKGDLGASDAASEGTLEGISRVEGVNDESSLAPVGSS